jgi:hypothetical protein
VVDIIVPSPLQHVRVKMKGKTDSNTKQIINAAFHGAKQILNTAAVLVAVSYSLVDMNIRYIQQHACAKKWWNHHQGYDGTNIIVPRPLHVKVYKKCQQHSMGYHIASWHSIKSSCCCFT